MMGNAEGALYCFLKLHFKGPQRSPSDQLIKLMGNTSVSNVPFPPL